MSRAREVITFTVKVKRYSSKLSDQLKDAQDIVKLGERGPNWHKHFRSRVSLLIAIDCDGNPKAALSWDDSRLHALLLGLETRLQSASHHSGNHRCIGHSDRHSHWLPSEH